MHEPEVECIANGKAGNPYEFGNKVSVAVTSRGGWLVGAKSFTGHPYDGHTLDAQMKQVQSMIGNRVHEAHVDMGYRGHDYGGAVTVHIDKRRRCRTSRRLWRWMKHRAAVDASCVPRVFSAAVFYLSFKQHRAPGRRVQHTVAQRGCAALCQRNLARRIDCRS